MNKPMDRLTAIAKFLFPVGKTQTAQDESPLSEQTEDDVVFDIWLNPWLGVDVYQHSAGRRPRRA